MVSKYIFAYATLIVLAAWVEQGASQNGDFDKTKDDHVAEHARSHEQRRKFHPHEVKDEFDVRDDDNSTATDYKGTESDEESGTAGARGGGARRRKIDNVGESSTSKRNRNRKREKERQEEQERGWHYCADGRPPKDVADLAEDKQHTVGHMCRDLYPTSTCCYDHDLTMELVGDKILEQIPEHQCARMLMKMRCAHCSPRSWWLFHAPDMIRYPHKRVLPIMCPNFCRKFHRLCRDSVAGLQADNFCDYHTTNEEGPCFPDSFIRRGTID